MRNGIVCLYNGMYKVWFARNYRTHIANTPDLSRYAEAYGAKGSRAETADEVAFKAGGIQLVAVPVDCLENTRVLTDELRQRMPAALRTP